MMFGRGTLFTVELDLVYGRVLDPAASIAEVNRFYGPEIGPDGVSDGGELRASPDAVATTSCGTTWKYAVGGTDVGCEGAHAAGPTRGWKTRGTLRGNTDALKTLDDGGPSGCYHDTTNGWSVCPQEISGNPPA